MYLTVGARTLLIAGTDRDQNAAHALCQQSRRPYKEADVSHTAERVFQIGFEEIYASDTSTWHIQFHGSGTCTEDVFLSNGVPNAPSSCPYACGKHRGGVDGQGEQRPL